LKQGYDLAETVVVLAQQVSDGDSDAPADSHHAVDEHVGLFPRLLDEIKGAGEVLGDLVVFVVLHGDEEVTRDVFLGVGQQTAAGHG
jgi:hypothetical protein